MADSKMGTDSKKGCGFQKGKGQGKTLGIHGILERVRKGDNDRYSKKGWIGKDDRYSKKGWIGRDSMDSKRERIGVPERGMVSKIGSIGALRL